MSTTHTPLRIPDAMTAPEIGAYLAQLRQQYNLSPVDVSERLHIRLRYIQALEQAQIDQMPGLTYARGYLHTYAEFLGLDANQVVAQWFPPSNSTVAAPVGKSGFIASAARSKKAVVNQWRGLSIAAVVAILAVLVMTQFMTAKQAHEAEEPVVAPVPEALLATVRTGLMPTPQNIRCFTSDLWLSCFFADNATRTLSVLETEGFPSLSDSDIARLTQEEETSPTDPTSEEQTND